MATTRADERAPRSPGLTPSEFRRRIIADPAWYCRSVLGQEPWEAQIEIMRSVLNNRRTAVAGCVGSSKTFAAAMAVLAFMHAYAPAEVYTTAPTFRQVKKVLWKEIRKMHKRARFPLGGKLLDTEWKLDDDWFAIGFSPKDPDSVHGAHAKNILVVIDEAQGVGQEIIEAAENALAGGNAHLLLTFNPNAEIGEEAYECAHGKRHIYHNIRIDADATPNVSAGHTVIPGMIEKAQRDEWVNTFGWDSNFVRVKVRALYPKQADDALVPIEWIEKAIHREAVRGEWALGVDVGRLGDDDSCIAPICGRQVMDLKIFHGKDNVELAGLVKQEADKLGAAKVFVDEIGIGSGVIDTLKAEKVRAAQGINVSNKAHKPGKFANLRSEITWALREALNPEDPEPLGLPNDLELIAELSTIKYWTDRQGRIVVESKDEIKKRLKRSPDRADAVILAHYAAVCSGRRHLDRGYACSVEKVRQAIKNEITPLRDGARVVGLAKAADGHVFAVLVAENDGRACVIDGKLFEGESAQEMSRFIDQWQAKHGRIVIYGHSDESHLNQQLAMDGLDVEPVNLSKIKQWAVTNLAFWLEHGKIDIVDGGDVVRVLVPQLESSEKDNEPESLLCALTAFNFMTMGTTGAMSGKSDQEVDEYDESATIDQGL